MASVSTYASYNNMVSNVLATKELLDKYTYQSMTGLKSESYSGYGTDASAIVSLEAAVSVNTTYMDNNNKVSTDLTLMSTSLETVSDLINTFKSTLTSFSGMSLETINPDQTGGELSFTNEDMTSYEGKTITANGVEYKISSTETGDNIIPLGSTPQELMKNVADTIDEMSYSENSEKLTFDLYTVDGYSSILNVDGVETGEPYLPSQAQSEMLNEVQNLAFSTMQMIADVLNTSGTSGYLFGGGSNSSMPVDFDFNTLAEFQAYYDGADLTYPTSAAAVSSNIKLDSSATGDLTINYTGGTSNTATIKSTETGGFLDKVMDGTSATTGELNFYADNQSVVASVSGAFNAYAEGDIMVVKGTDGNDGAFLVKSVSEDGKTVKLEPMEGTNPITTEPVAVSGDEAKDVSFSSTFPLNSIVSLDGIGSGIKDGQSVQVTGISPDGSELYVSVTSDFPTCSDVVINADTNWSMSTSGYYQGGTSSTQVYVSETQSINMNVTAADSAFEKMFLALGEIAQGNLTDFSDLSDPTTANVDSSTAYDRVMSALDLIDEALYNPTSNGIINNADFYSIQSKVTSNIMILDNVTEMQTSMNLNLENSISSLKNVDQEEAAVKALLATTQLEASYSVMSNAISLSLLNYL